MEVEQAAAVADADQDGVGQRFAQQVIHRVFEPLVHRRAGFVEKHDLRAIQQNTGNSQALLFSE